MYHFQSHIITIFLFKSLNQNPPSLLAFLWSLFLIKRITSQPQVPHNGLIDIKEVKNSKHNHENGKHINDWIRNGDFTKKLLKLRLLYGRELKVVVTQWVADPGHVHRREQQRCSSGMSLVKFKHPVDLDPEYGMCNHIHDVDHQKAVDKIRQWEIIIEPVNQANLFCSEYRHLSHVKHDTHHRSQHNQESVPDTLISVVVGREADCNITQLLHEFIQLRLAWLEMQLMLFYDLMQVCQRFPLQTTRHLIIWTVIL